MEEIINFFGAQSANSTAREWSDASVPPLSQRTHIHVSISGSHTHSLRQTAAQATPARKREERI